MSDDQSSVVTLKVRVTPEFREKITDAAKLNNRSMNAEIVHRLEQSFKNHIDISELLSATEDLKTVDKHTPDELKAMDRLEESHNAVLRDVAYAVFQTLNQSGYSLTKEEVAKVENMSKKK